MLSEDCIPATSVAENMSQTRLLVNTGGQTGGLSGGGFRFIERPVQLYHGLLALGDCTLTLRDGTDLARNGGLGLSSGYKLFANCPSNRESHRPPSREECRLAADEDCLLHECTSRSSGCWSMLHSSLDEDSDALEKLEIWNTLKRYASRTR